MEITNKATGRSRFMWCVVSVEELVEMPKNLSVMRSRMFTANLSFHTVHWMCQSSGVVFNMNMKSGYTILI